METLGNQMWDGGVDAIIVMISRASLTETGSVLVEAIATCERTADALDRGVETKLALLQKLRSMAQDICSTHGFVGKDISELLDEIGRDCHHSPGYSELRKGAVDYTEKFANNKVQLTEDVRNKVIGPLDRFLSYFAESKSDEGLRKEMRRQLKRLAEGRKRSAIRKITSTVTGNDNSDDRLNEKVKASVIAYFTHMVNRNAMLVSMLTILSGELSKCYESYLGREYAFTLKMSDSVIFELHFEASRAKKMAEEQINDLNSLRIAAREQSVRYSLLPELKNIEKEGCLLKCSSQYLKRWQKKKCRIKDGRLVIHSEEEHKKVVEIPLIMTSVKVADKTNRKFSLICPGDVGTIHFMAETPEETNEWVTAITNAKSRLIYDTIFNQQNAPPLNTGETVELIEEIKGLPGNDKCCDCNAKGPEWISLNLGTLLCIDCCGTHRELGAHLSRTQSLVMDTIKPNDLLIAKAIGNDLFNEVFDKMAKSRELACMALSNLRRSYIHEKYVSGAYVARKGTTIKDLFHYIEGKDFRGLLQSFGESVPFLAPNYEHPKHWNALMYAIGREEGFDIAVVEFLLYNSRACVGKTGFSDPEVEGDLNYVDVDGESIAHLCVRAGSSLLLSMVIKAGANTQFINNQGQDVLELAADLKQEECCQFLKSLVRRAADLPGAERTEEKETKTQRSATVSSSTPSSTRSRRDTKH